MSFRVVVTKRETITCYTANPDATVLDVRAMIEKNRPDLHIISIEKNEPTQQEPH